MSVLSKINERTQWFDKPKYPGFVDRVQHLKYIYTNPCNVPLIYYVETALPALGLALLEYMDFGVMDVVRGFAKPAALARGRHGSRRNRGRSRIPRLPDFGDEIGKKLRPDAIHKRQISDGNLHLWKLYGRLEHLLWWWMVADIAANFAYNWGSAIYDNEYCRKASELNGAWETPLQLHAGPIEEVGISGGTMLYHNPPRTPTINWAISAPPGHTLHAVLAGTVLPQNPLNPPIGAQLGYFVSEGGKTSTRTSGAGTAHEDGQHHILRTSVRAGSAMAPVTRKSGGGAARFENVTQVYWCTPD